LEILFGANRIPRQFFKENGGAFADDFVSVHSQKHMFNAEVPSTVSKTQFGQNINVRAIREDTMNFPDAAFSDLETRITKYSKSYDFNLSTGLTPTGESRVFINNLLPARSSQFPLAPRKP
jgi:hypothetical protein